MEITMNRKSAVDALNVAAKFTSRSLDVYQFLGLAAAAGKVQATAMGDSGRVTVDVDGTPSEDGLFLVKADMLVSLLQSVPGETVRIKKGSDGVTLHAGRSRYRLPMLADQSAAPEAVTAVTDGLSIPAARLLELLNFVEHAAASKDVRYYLNGVCLMIDDQQIAAGASDGHAAALAQWQPEGPIPQDMQGRQIIVPIGTVGKLKSAMQPIGDVVLSLDGHNLMLDNSSGFRFCGPTIDGRFPDIERVIPALGKGVQVTVTVRALKAAVDRAMIVSADERFSYVRMESKDGDLLASFVGTERDMEEVIETTEPAPKGFATAVATKYLRECLMAMPDDAVLLQSKAADEGLLLIPTLTAGRSEVIMPMRL